MKNNKKPDANNYIYHYLQSKKINKKIEKKIIFLVLALALHELDVTDPIILFQPFWKKYFKTEKGNLGLKAVFKYLVFASRPRKIFFLEICIFSWIFKFSVSFFSFWKIGRNFLISCTFRMILIKLIFSINKKNFFQSNKFFASILKISDFSQIYTISNNFDFRKIFPQIISFFRVFSRIFPFFFC